MTTLRIILADDHSLVRAGVRALLEDWCAKPSARPS